MSKSILLEYSKNVIESESMKQLSLDERLRYVARNNSIKNYKVLITLVEVEESNSIPKSQIDEAKRAKEETTKKDKLTMTQFIGIVEDER